MKNQFPELFKIHDNLNQSHLFEKVIECLAYPASSNLWDTITYTRSYEEGVQIYMVMLKIVNENEDLLDRKDFINYRERIYHSIMQLLDKLDRWEEYLEAFEHIKKEEGTIIKYCQTSREMHGERGVDPYIIYEDENHFYTHSAYSLDYRKNVIERKLAKKKAGKKIGNLFHAKLEELTEAEYQERLTWVVKFIETGNYEFNSPASKQQEKNQNTVKAVLMERLMSDIFSGLKS